MRTANIDGDTIHVTGDWSNQTRVEIWAPKNVVRATFNGLPLEVVKSEYGTLVGALQVAKFTTQSVEAQLPVLTEWKMEEGLPELEPTYDDSRWTGRPTPRLKTRKSSNKTNGE